MKGIGNTVALALTIIIAGGIAGVLICLFRLYGPKWLRWLAIVYIDVFRAIPILVLLVLIYYALPFLGIRLNGFASATLALGLVFSSFTAEVFRAGIQAIPKGQTEASEALGLSFGVTIWKVILPQAFRIAIPPHTSNAVAIAKDTSLASVVAMPDLLKQATDAQALTANPSPLIAAAIMYLIVLLPAVRLVSYLEERFRNDGKAA
ncbi:amino acid ABC transporter permease [Salinihabitans flavidus]|nr:amino acid ABC transporter permease [Salinihabitans flavidus]